jgi:hypothetical protein
MCTFVFERMMGIRYVLSHNEQSDEWTLESFRSPAGPGQYDPHFLRPTAFSNVPIGPGMLLFYIGMYFRWR